MSWETEEDRLWAAVAKMSDKADEVHPNYFAPDDPEELEDFIRKVRELIKECNEVLRLLE